MSQTGPSESGDSGASKSTVPSLSSELDELTTAVLEVSDNLQSCAQESDARHAAYLARVEQQQQRATSFQDQIAKMLAMTQEGLRREKEEPLKGMGPPFHTYLIIYAAACPLSLSLPALAATGRNGRRIVAGRSAEPFVISSAKP